jgi:hypothetical protein
MDVDPFLLHACWGLESATLEKARMAFGHGTRAHLVLRFRELPPPLGDASFDAPLPAAVFDQEIEGPSGQLEVVTAGIGNGYEAELGLTAADGGWLSLARSNRIRMPPAGPDSTLGRVSLDVSRQGQDMAIPAAATATAPLPESLTTMDPSLRGGGPDPLPPIFPNVAPRAQTLPKRPPGEVAPAIPVAIPARPAEETGLSAGTLLGRQWSSSVLARHPGLLELHAELHIYGRARRDRELMLLGRRVPVQANGRFELRQPLGTDVPQPSSFGATKKG